MDLPVVRVCFEFHCPYWHARVLAEGNFPIGPAAAKTDQCGNICSRGAAPDYDMGALQALP